MQRQPVGSKVVEELRGILAVWVLLCTIKTMVDLLFALEALYHACVYRINIVVLGGEDHSRCHVIWISHVVV